MAREVQLDLQQDLNLDLNKSRENFSVRFFDNMAVLLRLFLLLLLLFYLKKKRSAPAKAASIKSALGAEKADWA